MTEGAPPNSGGAAAAFFDLDKTIIATSSAFAFSRPFLAEGLMTRASVLRSAYAHFLFMAGGADKDQMEGLRRQLSDLVTGWNVDQVRDIVNQTLEEIIEPLVFREAQDLIEDHRAAGRDVIIVSASGADVVEPIGELLGADRVIATRMVVEDGCYTGEIAFYNYGENKAGSIRDLAAQAGYDLSASYAYSDSATDLPMLEAVGHPTAVNPDRALRREALGRGWPVLDFSHPISLRTRVSERVQRVQNTPPPPPSTLAAMVGAAVAAGALAWVFSHRRPPTA